jgi:hypothetical protein
MHHDQVWERVCGAAGGWVAEEELERTYRFAMASGYGWARRGRGPQGIIESFVKAWRANWEAITSWPEVEVGERSGRRFLRLRPERAAALSGRLRPAAKVHVQPNFEILAPREIPALDLLTLCRAAELRRTDVVATFVLTPASVQRAALGGLGATALCERLGAMAAYGVPDSVLRSIRDWVADVGRVGLRSVALVQLDDAALADRAVTVLGKLAERVGPCAFVAAQSDWPELVKRLRTAGMTPRSDRRTDGEGEQEGDGQGEGEGEGEGKSQAGATDVARHDLRAADGAASPGPTAPALGLAQPPARVEALRRLREIAATGRGASSPFAAAQRPQPTAAPGAEARAASTRSPAAAPAPAPAPAPSPPLRRPPAAVTKERIARVILEALSIDAELSLVLSGAEAGAPVAVRPIAQEQVDGAARVRALDATTRRQITVPLARITSATLLPETARRLGRNQPCPCGSGRKFKRCCSPFQPNGRSSDDRSFAEGEPW